MQFPYISYILILFSEINEFITAQQEAWTSAYLYLIFLHKDFLILKYFNKEIKNKNWSVVENEKMYHFRCFAMP